MAYKGLFIGIDRYSSPDINWLNCAKNDAFALHALFSDNLEGESTILVDEDATRLSIKESFEKLQQCEKEDVVIIGFSGHGSDTHELITHDADLNDLSNSCIPLSELFNWFAKIPAKRVIFILDCCFSGGMGAKALQVDFSSREISSAENLLHQMSGEGRIIFTASLATEQAWENQKRCHGFLTYYLLEALKGAEEVRQDGKIDIYSLLKYVTDRVIAAAEQIGKHQHPAMRGTMDGQLSFPIFIPGSLFKKYFPQYSKLPVTEEIQSLESYGFPSQVIDIWAGSIKKLNSLQIEAINNFKILDGDHLVVSAPTSSGKTMIGELAALGGITTRKRTIFLLPLKALVNDKHRSFSNLYAPYGVRTIRATGDSNDDIPYLMKGQYDICLMTYEKFTALALGFPHLLEQVATVVIDEVQMITDKSRGINLEFILTMLRVRRQQGIEPQLIALSAVIGGTNGFEKWLNARLLLRTERPVPLNEGFITSSGSFRYIDSETKKENTDTSYVRQEPRKGSSQDWIVPLVRKLVSEGKQVIVFRETKGEARGAANYLADELNLPSADKALAQLPNGDPSLVSGVLRKCLSKGIAFHISDLDRDERLVVEEIFREKDSKIRVIVATTTLAMGVNTPAEAVIIAGLEHPGLTPQPYSIAEYKNIVGRAGRLGFATRGSSYLLALTPREEYMYWDHYINGVPEDLISQFLNDNTDARSLIVRVLVAAKRSAKNEMKGMSSEDIINFLECSFGAFQQSQLISGWKWDHEKLTQSLANLEHHKLIVKTNEKKYKLTELGWLAGQGGVEVESITRLVDILEPLSPLEITDPALIAATQYTVEVDQLFFPVNPKGPQKELDSWLTELRYQNIPNHILQLLGSGFEVRRSATRLKKIVACLFWISDKSFNDIEGVLTRHGGRFDGVAGAVRGAASRTHDLLGITARVAEILHPGLHLQDRVAKLFVRLEVGVPASLYDLAKIIGTTFTRSDYLTLIKLNLWDVNILKDISEEDLLNALEQNKEKLNTLQNAIDIHFRNSFISNDLIPSLPLYEA
jgi:replicative superfamily II helicase